MKRTILIILLFLSGIVCAAHSEGPEIALEKVIINTQDKASIARGAKFFAGNCMVCHSVKYLEHNNIAQKAGITLDKMPLKNQNWWLGVVPPDLTLVARERSADWIYTYLHAFYKDPSRPTGYNNLLVPNVNMMNVLSGFQGDQVLIKPESVSLSKPHYYTLLKLVRAGSMSPQEFDRTTADLVNFLVYASDPGKTQRENIGIWVLLFLVLLFVMAYILKNMYWKDVK